LIRNAGAARQPAAVCRKIRETVRAPNSESSDILTFKDGRVFERYSIRAVDAHSIGRVWSFRDVTARRGGMRAGRPYSHIAQRRTRRKLQSCCALSTRSSRLMPAKNFYVALYDPQRDQLEFPISWTNTIRLETFRPQASQRIDRVVLRTGRPLLATPTFMNSSCRRRGGVDRCAFHRLDGRAAHGEGPHDRHRRGADISAGVRYGQGELDILTFVSSQMAMAIERKRGEDALREQRARPGARGRKHAPRRGALPCLYRANLRRRVAARDRSAARGHECRKTSKSTDCNAGAQIAECNDAMARMYGYHEARTSSATRLADLHDVGDPANREQNPSFIRAGYRLSDSETREKARDGRPRVFLNNVVGFVGRDGWCVSGARSATSANSAPRGAVPAGTEDGSVGQLAVASPTISNTSAVGIASRALTARFTIHLSSCGIGAHASSAAPDVTSAICSRSTAAACGHLRDTPLNASLGLRICRRL